ncbi:MULTISPECIES: hypothetical protein [Micromonospora]|uniref:Uncharacterized protein n=1 Tax=Micromonospora haikouensis TaxID=686309 RepID=A0A0D0X1L8_9ACTN|nr:MULTISPECIES: hypothetical protein [Micromonospora]KIR63400.1 hypothetical protein TK50_21505 [Micromonospora haikouensis]OON29199.1 hypothetical protein BSA16_22755 [Micromonospora sp. Rc5]SCE94604.1 hypothetical protein GA0070558_11520 [Micromonospora haikouensis]
MGDAERRRRRSRHHTDGETPAAATAGTQDVAAEPPRRRPAPGGDDRDGGERGLRGLVGPGSSQVGPRAAMRARDAARPTEADLAEAEQRVVVVRRNWVPREDLPRSGR